MAESWRGKNNVLSYEEKRAKAIALEPAVLDLAPSRTPRYHRTPYRFVKRATDLVLGSLALIVLLPVFVVISALIAITEGRPIIFRQTRLGIHGREFPIF